MLKVGLRLLGMYDYNYVILAPTEAMLLSDSVSQSVISPLADVDRVSFVLWLEHLWLVRAVVFYLKICIVYPVISVMCNSSCEMGPQKMIWRHCWMVCHGQLCYHVRRL